MCLVCKTLNDRYSCIMSRRSHIHRGFSRTLGHLLALFLALQPPSETSSWTPLRQCACHLHHSAGLFELSCPSINQTHLSVGASGKPGNWATWWILDGGDDAESLRAADVRAKLNAQVADAVRTFKPGGPLCTMAWLLATQNAGVSVHGTLFYGFHLSQCVVRLSFATPLLSPSTE